MSAHLDLDGLADVLAGQAAPAHLQECGDCQRALTELSTATAAVTGALAQLPDPQVPPELADRLTAAINAERGPAAAGSVGSAGSVTVMPLGQRPAGPSRWLRPAGIAAAVVLVAGGAGVVALTGGSGGGTTHGSTAAKTDSASSANTALARNDTGTDYAKNGTALTAALPQLLAGDAPQSTRVSAGKAAAAPQRSPGPAPDAAAPSFSVDGADPLAVLRTPAGLASCLSSLTDPSDPGVPLALDYGSFEGRPALLVLLPASKPTSVLAYFVGPGCAPADAKVLFYEKLPKP